ncbi:MAG: MBOAT family protein [Bacteroidales bacterium]|nr:MBOAT family protein [Bacteroidales bacterium]
MLFNSIEFLIFLPVVFLLYWFVFDKFLGKYKHKLILQNAFVVVASYVFYGWWDWRFLLLIALTTLCSWLSGILMRKVEQLKVADEYDVGLQIVRKRKLIAAINIAINLAILATFKYYDFFVTEFARLFGLASDGILLNIILPVGISFYTFQALSYSIDVYRHKIEPTKDIVAFFAFISFFPQLVAGPIERATNLLPQFLKKREFDYNLAIDGSRQILWGLFKKVVIADNCAIVVDQVFSDYANMPASSLLVGALFFTFQIYGDFSGYSDIAIGTANLFGIKLMRNFNVPYFSRDIAEFWRRWHISLNTWFRDYVYIPLGGSRTTKIKIIRNTFVIFLLSGLWHGANWTFIAWGAFHALLFCPLILLGKNRRYTNVVAEDRLLPSVKEGCMMLITFMLVVVGWIIFRAGTITDAWYYICGLFDSSLFTIPSISKRDLIVVPFIVILIVVEWLNRQESHGLFRVGKLPYIYRYLVYTLIILIIFFMRTAPKAFIYFQF